MRRLCAVQASGHSFSHAVRPRRDIVVSFWQLLSCPNTGSTLAVLERYTRHAMGIWTALGVTVLALSFAPIAIAGASAPTKAALSLIHLSVAGVLLVTMRRSAGRA